MPIPEYNLNNTYMLPKLENNMKPYKYQEFGYQFIRNRVDEFGFCMLADSVGLGKTLQIILTIASMYREGHINKVLILCKKALKRQWAKEIDKFTSLKSEMEYIEYIPDSATKKKRDKMYEAIKKANSGILVTTYESTMNDGDIIKDVGFNFVVIDEVHVIKTPNSKKNTAVKKSIKKIPYKVLLTGTPITNKPIDLYGVIGLCTDKYFSLKITAFKKRYVTYWDNGMYKADVGFKHIDELRDKCQSIMLRRTEHEVALELPKVLYKNVYCQIDSIQESLIELIMKMFKDVLKKLDKEDITPVEKEKLEAKKRGILGLRQIVANDVNIFSYGQSFLSKKLLEDIDIDNNYISGKTINLKKIVANIVSCNQKVIIFSKYERTCRYLKDVLKDIGKVVTYTGKLSEDDRNKNIDNFCDEEDYNILIATNSAAEGLNLAVANHIVNYDLPDTVAIGTQRMGRARRAGSEYSRVIVYNMITRDSVDIKVKEKLDKQKKLFSSIVELSEEESKEIKKLSN